MTIADDAGGVDRRAARAGRRARAARRRAARVGAGPDRARAEPAAVGAAGGAGDRERAAGLGARQQRRYALRRPCRATRREARARQVDRRRRAGGEAVAPQRLLAEREDLDAAVAPAAPSARRSRASVEVPARVRARAGRSGTSASRSASPRGPSGSSSSAIRLSWVARMKRSSSRTLVSDGARTMQPDRADHGRGRRAPAPSSRRARARALERR